MKIIDISITKVSFTVLTFLLTYQINMVDPIIAQTPQSLAKQTSEFQISEAKRVWELAITAKGGHDKLYAIRSVLIRSDTSAGAMKIKIRPDGTKTKTETEPNLIQQVSLFVLPDKYWLWNDLRPSVFGLQISMENYEAGISYRITPHDRTHVRDPIPSHTIHENALKGFLILLLETKWLKPTLIAAHSGRVNGKEADIVETMIDEERWEFAFDKETHMLLSTAYIRSVGKQLLISTDYYSDYVDVDGIKMAQQIRMSDDYDKRSVDYRRSYQFNVEYNEDIFLKPPLIDAGPEAWKPKK